MWYHSNETDLNPAFPLGGEEAVKEAKAHFWLERFCYMCNIAEWWFNFAGNARPSDRVSCTKVTFTKPLITVLEALQHISLHAGGDNNSIIT